MALPAVIQTLYPDLTEEEQEQKTLPLDAVSAQVISNAESDTDKTLILWNEEERFPLVGKKPYPAFGQNTNRDYLIYLLSKQNIYFNFVEIDHILMVILSEELSDMSEVKLDN